MPKKHFHTVFGASDDEGEQEVTTTKTAPERPQAAPQPSAKATSKPSSNPSKPHVTRLASSDDEADDASPHDVNRRGPAAPPRGDGSRKVYRPETESSRGQQLPPSRHWTPEMKLKLRREERQLKKDRSRALQYFLSVEEALKTVAAQQKVQEESGVMEGDAPVAGLAMSDVLDGFCTELTRRVRTDVLIFHNRAACRVTELALSAAELRHVEALVFALLGQFPAMMTSPTASFVVETLFASVYHTLGTRQRRAESFVAEETERPSGMPSIDEMLGLIVKEVVADCETLVWDKAGAKCLSSFMLMLAGFPIRGVPREDVAFQHHASVVARAVIRLLNDGRVAANGEAEDGWTSACLHPSACFVVQALTKCAPLMEPVRLALSNHLEPILPTLAEHPTIGSRVVESFAACGGSAAWALVFRHAQEAGAKAPVFAVGSLVDGMQSPQEAEELWDKVFSPHVEATWLSPTPDATASPAITVFLKYITRCAPAPETDQPTKTEVERVTTTPEHRQKIVQAVYDLAKKVSSKGPAQALCVDMAAGPQSVEVCSELLSFGRHCAALIMNSFDKVRIDALLPIATTVAGSLVLQRLIDCLVTATATHKAEAGKPSPMMKFARRLESAIVNMAQDKHGSFVVQHLYQQGAIDVRELVANALAQSFHDLRNHFIASKVLVQCFVEQFLYRREEWRAMSLRQANVKRLMAVIVAAEEAPKKATAAPAPVQLTEKKQKQKAAAAAAAERRVKAKEKRRREKGEDDEVASVKGPKPE